MTIILSDQAKEFLEKNNIEKLLIDVSVIKEACLEIVSPSLIVVKDNDLESIKYQVEISTGFLNVYISKKFIKIFGNYHEYKINLKGFFEKTLTLGNVNPIIKNICDI
ncbi:MAG: hypothetical protein ACTSQJ_03785 [Promethearchaeota archaeon]